MTEAEKKLEYIKAMIEFARDDARQVYLRVTGLFAVVALFLTQLPFKQLQALHLWPTRALFVGLLSMIGGALLYFTYVGRVHHSRVRLAECLLTLDVEKAEDESPKVWRRWGWVFHAGDALAAVGFGFLAYVLVEMIAGVKA